MEEKIKMMENLVSVILPVYNQENFLAQTIESVLNQSYKDYEFLILDDGSTDGSAKIIKKYAELDPRINDFYDENFGKAIATNRLAEKSKGEFLVFLDADDLMLSSRIEEQLKYHEENPEVDGSSCHCYYIDINGKEIGKQRYPFLKNIHESQEALKRNDNVHCAFTGLMVKRSNFLQCGGLRQNFWPAEDLDFVYRFMEKGNILVIIQKFLMNYRIHSDSITYKKGLYMIDKGDYVGFCMALRRKGEEEIFFEEFMKFKERKPLWEKSKKRLLYSSQDFHKKAGFYLYQKQYIRFLSHITLAIFCSPKYVLSSLKNRLAYSRMHQY